MGTLDFQHLLASVRAGAALHIVPEAQDTLCNRIYSPNSPHPYARDVLFQSPTGEVMLAAWTSDATCAVHDHGGAGGMVMVLAGQIEETPHHWDAAQGLVAGASVTHAAGTCVRIPRSGAHAMRAVGNAVTLHLYTPAPGSLRVHDTGGAKTYVLRGEHGAWLPTREEDVLRTELWRDTAARRARPVVAIFYTTHYRSGSADFARVAATMAADLQARQPHAEVVVHAVHYKREFTAACEAYADDARALAELHFIGHSGMYGVMFGSTAWPEQLSPHEWRSLRIPFTPGGIAVFHACRTGRWFAPFFARTFGVQASGHHGYTTVSRSPVRYQFDSPLRGHQRAVHVISCVGRKSHGTVGMIRKHLGRAPADALRTFAPTPADAAPSYDGVAPLYDAAFEDIRVRGPEFAYVQRALECMKPGPLRVLDVGCGNGALLAALGARLGEGVGVDVSQGMLSQAHARQQALPHLRFEKIHGPTLPFADGSFDVVISFLSFRYLDWDPALAEFERVLAPDGKLIVVDMVDKALQLREWPLLARSAIAHSVQRRKHPELYARLHKLRGDPRWQEMLRYNPIRAEHEYRWYLESRFPGQRVQVLSASRTARVVAFDSGPKRGPWQLTPMSFP